MSHTKGPWTIEEGELTANGAVLGTIYGADDFPCNEEDIDEECKANANLIAAAPDLLTLAEEFIRALSTDQGREVDNRIRIELAPLLKQAKEVVAKAKGEAP